MSARYFNPNQWNGDIRKLNDSEAERLAGILYRIMKSKWKRENQPLGQTRNGVRMPISDLLNK